MWKCLNCLLFCLLLLVSVDAFAQKPIMHLPSGHSESITKLLPSKNKKYLVSFSRKDGKLFVSNTAYRKMLYEISDPKSIFLDIYVVKDSGQIAVSGIKKENGKGFVHFYDIRNGKYLKGIERLSIGAKRLPVFNENGSCFIASSSKGKVGLYDIPQWNISWLRDFDIKRSDWQVFKQVNFKFLTEADSSKPRWIVSSVVEKGIYITNGETNELHSFLEGHSYYNHFQIEGQFFLVTQERGRKSGWYYQTSVWQLDSMNQVFDKVSEVIVDAASSIICSCDSSDAVQFYTLHKRNKIWEVKREEKIEALVSHIKAQMFGFRLHGLINDRFLLMEHDDSLSVIDFQQGTFNAIFDSYSLSEVDVVESSEGDEYVSILAKDEEYNELFYKINYDEKEGFQINKTTKMLSDGIWEKRWDVWISASEKGIEYFDLGKEGQYQYVSGKIVNSEESKYIGLQTDDVSSRHISVLCDDGKVRVYDATRGKLLRTITSEEGEIKFAKTNRNTNYLVTITDYRNDPYWRSVVEVWNIKNGSRITTKHSIRGRINAAVVSLDRNILYYADDDKYLRKWDLNADTLISYKYAGSTDDLEINKQGNLMIVQDYNSAELWSLDSFSQVTYLSGGRAIFSPSGTELLTLGTVSGMKEYRFLDSVVKIGEYHYYKDTLNGRKFESVHTQRVIKAAYSPNGKRLLSAGLDGQLVLWDRETNKVVNKRPTNLGRVNGLSFSPNGEKFVASSEDQKIKIWASETSKELATIVLLEDDASITLTPDNYYYATGDVSQYVSWQVGDKFLSFEQLDLKYNRPDIVLQSLSSPDTNLIKAYNLAYKKRLNRLNLSESNFNEMLPPPELNLSNSGFEKFQVDNSFLDLKIIASDTYTPLTSFNIWMNGVPLYGVNGLDLSGRRTYKLDTAVRVDLINGLNKIEASVVNEKGIESFREPYFVKQIDSSAKVPKIYFFGIALDEYNESNWNLNYSVKDIRDLVGSISTRDQNVVVDTLFNNNVTKEAIDSVLDQLAAADPNDKLIMSFSGHGLLSDQFDYYFSTYGVDFANPEVNGYSYDKLENKLAQLKIRRRLLMIDACHSGEVDKASLLALNEIVEKTGLKGATIVGQENDLDHLGLESSFDLMNDLFLKVGNETGTVVISAAAGTQFALEDGELSNGVFTFAVLEFLSHSDKCSMSDLQNWVKKRVPELTSGAQNPTSRSVNYSLDWSF
jgi:WD40 repeat protein